jgi:hypothetical protein
MADTYDLMILEIKRSQDKMSNRNNEYKIRILQHVGGLKQLSRDKRFRGTNLASFCSKEADRLENALWSAIIE